MKTDADSEKGNAPKTIHILLVEDNAADVYLLEKALQSRNISYSLTRS